MKKGILAFIVALIVFGSILEADGGYRYEITPILSKQISKADSALDDSKIFYGIRTLINASDNIALQVGYERSDNAKMGDGGKSDVVRVKTNLLLALPNSSKLTPYAIMGAGYEKLYREYAGENSQVFLNGGAGVKYALSDKVDLIVEGSIIQKIENQDTDAILGTGLSFKYGSMNVSSSSIYKSSSHIEDVSKKEIAIPVKDLAKLTPKSKQPIKKVEPVEVVSNIKDDNILEDVVVEDITNMDDTGESLANTSIAPDTVYEEVVVEDDLSSLEPVEFVGEPIYDDIDANNISEEEFVDSGYYVQMEASFYEPTTSLLDKLDSQGYSYILQPSVRKGRSITLVLVGPYLTRADAKRDLRKLRKIKKDAFIYKLK